MVAGGRNMSNRINTTQKNAILLVDATKPQQHWAVAIPQRGFEMTFNPDLV